MTADVHKLRIGDRACMYDADHTYARFGPQPAVAFRHQHATVVSCCHPM